MIPMEGREYGNGLTPGQTGIDWLSRHDLIRQDFPRRVLEPKAGRMRVDLPLEIAGRQLRHRRRKVDSRAFVGIGHRFFLAAGTYSPLPMQNETRWQAKLAQAKGLVPQGDGKLSPSHIVQNKNRALVRFWFVF